MGLLLWFLKSNVHITGRLHPVPMILKSDWNSRRKLIEYEIMIFYTNKHGHILCGYHTLISWYPQHVNIKHQLDNMCPICKLSWAHIEDIIHENGTKPGVSSDLSNEWLVSRGSHGVIRHQPMSTTGPERHSKSHQLLLATWFGQPKVQLFEVHQVFHRKGRKKCGHCPCSMISLNSKQPQSSNFLGQSMRHFSFGFADNWKNTSNWSHSPRCCQNSRFVRVPGAYLLLHLSFKELEPIHPHTQIQTAKCWRSLAASKLSECPTTSGNF